jgi:hypothetical protein
MTGVMQHEESGFEEHDVNENDLGYGEVPADGDDLDFDRDCYSKPVPVSPLMRLTALYANYTAGEQEERGEPVDVFMKRVQAVMKFIRVVHPSADMVDVEMRVAELAIGEKDEQELAFDRPDHLAHWIFTGEKTMPKEAVGNAAAYMTTLGEIVKALLTEDLQTGTYYQGTGFQKAFDRIFGTEDPVEPDDAAAHGEGDHF